MQEIYQSLIAAGDLIRTGNADLYGIILLTLAVTVVSTFLASLLGIVTGVFTGSRSFPGKRFFIRVIHTLMGLPPVVAGLVVYLALSRRGPFGQWQLLFTPGAMIIAQVIIVYPIITGLTIAALKPKSDSILESCRGLGFSGIKSLGMLLYECRYGIISAILTGYGRAISEVGAVMLVGGNIQGQTRVMTTAIVLETGKGNYAQALALGLILLILSFAVNWIVQYFQVES